MKQFSRGKSALSAPTHFLKAVDDEPNPDYSQPPPWQDPLHHFSVAALTHKTSKLGTGSLAGQAGKALEAVGEEHAEVCQTDGSVDPHTKRLAAAFVCNQETSHYRLPDNSSTLQPELVAIVKALEHNATHHKTIVVHTDTGSLPKPNKRSHTRQWKTCHNTTSKTEPPNGSQRPEAPEGDTCHPNIKSPILHCHQQGHKTHATATSPEADHRRLTKRQLARHHDSRDTDTPQDTTTSHTNTITHTLPRPHLPNRGEGHTPTHMPTLQHTHKHTTLVNAPQQLPPWTQTQTTLPAHYTHTHTHTHTHTYSYPACQLTKTTHLNISLPRIYLLLFQFLLTN